MNRMFRKISFSKINASALGLFLSVLLSLLFMVTPRLSAIEHSSKVVEKKLAGGHLSVFGRLTSSRWAYGTEFTPDSLKPVENAIINTDDKGIETSAVIAHPRNNKLYVAVGQNHGQPGSEIFVFDFKRKKLVKKIKLKNQNNPHLSGSRPIQIAFLPDDRYLVSINEYSNFASVIDTTIDRVVGEIPLDYYCQDIIFSPEGNLAFVSNRYLNQILIVKLDRANQKIPYGFHPEILGGLDERAYFENGDQNKGGEIYKLLLHRCGECHSKNSKLPEPSTLLDKKAGFFPATERLYESYGRFIVDASPRECFVSLLPHVKPGNASASRLIRATISSRMGGYADASPPIKSHDRGQVIFRNPSKDRNYSQLVKWINNSGSGPGVEIGNESSFPCSMVISKNGRYLYTGQKGGQSISIVDTRLQKEVGLIYVQNAVLDLALYYSTMLNEEFLIAATMGVGFGVMRERDAFAGESWDRNNPAAQFSVFRDQTTGDILPQKRQMVLGPYNVVDGTANIKGRDIQNDLIVIRLSQLTIPKVASSQQKDPYVLKVNKYEAHNGWVRYTSDTAESTIGDIKGDIPPDLMRVSGSLPYKLLIKGNKLYVLMKASGSIQEWEIIDTAKDPANYLVPQREFSTGFGPVDFSTVSTGSDYENFLFVANKISKSISIINLLNDENEEISIVENQSTAGAPENPNLGQLLTETSYFSSDGDSSCLHCHLDYNSDSRAWGISGVMGQQNGFNSVEPAHQIVGGALSTPDLKNLFDSQPLFKKGTHSGFEMETMLEEISPFSDFARSLPEHRLPSKVNLEKNTDKNQILEGQMRMKTAQFGKLRSRRATHFKNVTNLLVGKSYGFRACASLVGLWLLSDRRLKPNPFDRENTWVKEGEKLFHHRQLSCASCHRPPHFVDQKFSSKSPPTFDPVVMVTRRDASFSAISPFRQDFINQTPAQPFQLKGSAEHPDRKGHTVIPSLRGLWDRPSGLLHNGMALTLTEVICVPGQLALGKYRIPPLVNGNFIRPKKQEIGFNETFWYSEKSKIGTILLDDKDARIGIDTHGGVSMLRDSQVQQLNYYLKTIE